MVDDSYNANPASMISGLNVLNDFVSSKRKIALLGDMVEMGNYTKEGHEKVGSSLVNYNLDQVYLFGESSKYIREKSNWGRVSERETDSLRWYRTTY